MQVYVAKTDRMDITWRLSSGYVFVQQKWRYHWINEQGFAPWTYQEKLDFHHRADKWIWKFWSSQAYAMITGSSKLAIDYRNTKFKINVDIRWVIGNEHEHWNVYVTKKQLPNSQVFWDIRRINLCLNDINYESHEGKVEPSITYGQVTVAHEFGHALGNSPLATSPSDTPYSMHGDENRGSGLSKYRDDASIMSVGSNVRLRHFDYLKQQLKNMIHQDVEVYLF